MHLKRLNWLGRAAMVTAVIGYGPFAHADDLEKRVVIKRRGAEAARIEAAENIRRDAMEQRKEVEARLKEIKQWTQAQFELAERSVIDKPKVMTTLLERWHTQHEREIYRLLQFPDQSRGSIESAKALNTLLSHVGPAAYQHHLARNFSESAALPLYAPTANDRIDKETLEHLSWTSMTLGSGAGGSFSEDGLIDVRWPAVLREERWSEHRGAIESARSKVLSELGSGNGVSSAADAELRGTISKLNADFAAYRIEWFQNPDSGEGSRPLKYRRICDGRTHIKKLIRAVYYVVEGTTRADVAPEAFPGGTVEELLAYMHKNNLQFAEPSRAVDRNAYYRVFNMMVRYYLDLKTIANMEQRLEQELDDLKETNQEAIDVALGKTLSAANQAALMIEEMKFVRALVED